MPSCTLHLLALDPVSSLEFFLADLHSSRNVIFASRPRHTIIPPTSLDKDRLIKSKWDLLVLIQTAPDTTALPIPEPLQNKVKDEYRVHVGIPSKLVSTYTARHDALKKAALSVPLTGSLSTLLSNKSSTEDGEVPPELLSFMETLMRTHPGPVTMFNLLHFHQPDGKKSYYKYGQAFVPVAAKRGGQVKLVGNVIGPWPSSDREQWDEISIVHYPSIRHFCDMLAGDDYQEINKKHRLSVRIFSFSFGYSGVCAVY